MSGRSTPGREQEERGWPASVSEPDVGYRPFIHVALSAPLSGVPWPTSSPQQGTKQDIPHCAAQPHKGDRPSHLGIMATACPVDSHHQTRAELQYKVEKQQVHMIQQADPVCAHPSSPITPCCTMTMWTVGPSVPLLRSHL